MFNIFTNTKTTQSEEVMVSEEIPEIPEIPALFKHTESPESIRRKFYDTKWFPFRLYNNYLESQYDEIIYKSNRLGTTPISIINHEDRASTSFYFKLFMISSVAFLLSIKKQS
jgi:hypothetical protein